MKGKWSDRLKHDIGLFIEGGSGNFDLGRLTFLGWLWALGSLVVLFGGLFGLIALFAPTGDHVEELNHSGLVHQRWFQRVVGIPVMAVFVAAMMLGRYLLEDWGLVLIRPTKEEAAEVRKQTRKKTVRRKGLQPLERDPFHDE